MLPRMGGRIDRSTGRYFLKDDVRQEVEFAATAQSRGDPAPPIEKPWPAQAERVKLPPPGSLRGIAPVSVEQAIRDRRSHRAFRDAPLSLDELAFLLWSTQGIHGKPGRLAARRTVPSAGCRHAFETYLAVSQVTELEPALYRYLPLEHELLLERRPAPSRPEITAATHGQEFVAEGAVVFFFTVIPARMEWRYAEASYKVLAVDAGHVAENLYLACACIGAGTCAVAAYRQDLCDRLLGVDGEDEFTIYLAPVGKL
jgi:SagB-type dehydrogenase family enzyme